MKSPHLPELTELKLLGGNATPVSLMFNIPPWPLTSCAAKHRLKREVLLKEKQAKMLADLDARWAYYQKHHYQYDKCTVDAPYKGTTLCLCGHSFSHHSGGTKEKCLESLVTVSMTKCPCPHFWPANLPLIIETNAVDVTVVAEIPL